MIGRLSAFAVLFGALLGALLALCSYVAAQAGGELRLLGSHRIGQVLGQLATTGWFVLLLAWFLAIAVFGGLALFGLTP